MLEYEAVRFTKFDSNFLKEMSGVTLALLVGQRQGLLEQV